MKPLTADATRFHQLLVEVFTIEELNTLCFDLNINHESIPGRTLEERSRELIAYCRRRRRLGDLFLECQRSRPQTAWRDIFTADDRAPGEEIPDLETLLAGLENGQLTIQMASPHGQAQLDERLAPASVWQQLFTPDDIRSLRNRERMLARVYNFWIRGVLDHALYENVFIKLVVIKEKFVCHNLF